METNKDKVKVASKIARGDSYFLAPNATVYYTRGDDEVRSMYEDDRRNGNTMLSRSDIFEFRRGVQGSVRLPAPTAVVITRLNRAEWHGWGKKPTGLVTATVTTGPYIGRSVAVYRDDLKIKM